MLGFALAALLVTPWTVSAQVKAPANYDPAFVEQILKRLEAQESELKELRAAKTREQSPDETALPETFPQISFHGFGDVNFVFANDRGGQRESFALGQFDLFLTSQLAENLSVLSETVVEADSIDGNFVVELERLLLQWRPSDSFNLDLGRYHTAVGYYNTAFHHGTWFQTATGRPGFLDFEDGGGLIPAHNVGVSLSGLIPSGKLGLRYVVEVGNGRHYHDPAHGDAPVQSVSDDNDFKSVNVAFTARPDWVSGLQVGAGVYVDRLTPEGLPRTGEMMLHAHLVYKSGPWEFLSEGYYVRRSPKGGRSATTPAVFAQMARRFGPLTPYVRFSYINASDHDAVWQLLGSNGLNYGPAVGLRWDFSALAAFKVQYDFQTRRHLGELNTLTLQACFTF